MPEWLSDPSPTGYLVLAAVAAGSGVYCYRTQTRRGVMVWAAGLGLLGLVALADLLYESPREEAVRRVGEMIEAANVYRPAGVAPHLSDRFRYGDWTKDTFASAATWDLARRHSVKVAAWDFDRGYVERPTPETLALGFMLRAEADAGRGLFFTRAEFVRETDGAWRLRTFTLYRDPVRKANGDEFVIPGSR